VAGGIFHRHYIPAAGVMQEKDTVISSKCGLCRIASKEYNRKNETVYV